jgi:hypothetical protein
MKTFLISLFLILMVSAAFAGGPLPPPPVTPEEPYYSNGVGTTTKLIDYKNAAVQTLTLGGNCSVSWVLPPSGYRTSVVLKITQNTGAHYNITWVGTAWQEGLVPLITQNDAGVDFISCYVDDTGAYCTFGSDFH